MAANKRLAIDANILLVLAYGFEDKQALGNKRRVREYMPADYDLALAIISDYQQIVVTPNVVTECSDLFSDDGDSAQKEWLKAFVGQDGLVRIERYVPSAVAMELPQYQYLGVADCSLLSLVDDDTALLTTDALLYIAAASINPHCMNFNHLRNFQS